MSKTRRALLTLLALALLRWPVDVLIRAVLPDAAIDPLPQCVAGILLSVLLLGLPAWLLRPWSSDRLSRKDSPALALLLAGCGAVLVRGAMSPVDAAWQAWLNIGPSAMPVPESLPMAMLFIAALVIVPAVTEEAFFRGALLTSLLDGGRRWTAVLVTAAAFALMHGSLANLPGLLVLSLLLTGLMLESGSIAVPMTAHLIYNLTALNRIAVPGWGSIVCGAGLLALAAYLTLRQPRYAHQPMKWQDGLIAAASLGTLAAVYLV